MERVSLFDWPTIYCTGLPHEEEAHGRAVAMQLTSIEETIFRFDAAIALLSFTRGRLAEIVPTRNSRWSPEVKALEQEAETLRAWISMAGRDSAVAIHDMWVFINQIEANAKKAPTLWAMLDRELLKQAVDLFERSFPASKGARNAAVHAGIESEKWRAKHAYTGPIPKEMGSGKVESSMLTLVMGDVFEYTRNGVLCRFELSHASAKLLRDIAAIVKAAMERARTETFELVKGR